ncbi:MAG: 3-phosphoserine/phosphohydroxythreonine transaminase [Myxococcales bacterium]|nr:3-phosphoserine/phosphohydroxythreonine transaminase [Myxococcales bacterium]
MTERLFNFSAGPAILPEPVLQSAQSALWAFEDSGIGILEHSHRGALFSKVIEETEANCRKLAGISDDYEVLFLQGGASTQFFMIPMSWLGEGKTASYVNTGTWSNKAIKEAKLYGDVHVAASSEDKNFSYLPTEAEIQWPAGAAYAHYTSNNTIAGTQFAGTPTVPEGVPLICDASSDIFSKPIDVGAHGMIYAGAQKNLGPSGLALVIVRKDMVETAKQELPSMLQYRVHAKTGSCFNTPPTFGIYIMGEVFKWILEQGGLDAMAKLNESKAAILYDYLDESAMFRGTARESDRSLMNIAFRATSEELEAQFIKEATAAGLPGLKGHRSVGGMRASTYNAFPAKGVTFLVDFMKSFENKNK